MNKFKILFSSFIVAITFILFNCYAAETSYKNVITDTSSIEDDFEILGMDINEYYEPKSYDYDKWYVIAMSEAYVDTTDYDIQTYFYLYNPVKYSSTDRSKISDFKLKYKFNENGAIQTFNNGTKLMYDEEHLIYKIKGFTYEYLTNAEIHITEISYNIVTSGTLYTCSSTFKSVNNHSKLNGFTVELAFDSMLVLEEYKVVSVKVTQDNPMWNSFLNMFTGAPESMYVYFYNFNFPDHIKYDDVIYAKFDYDKVHYETLDYESVNYHSNKSNITNILNTENITEEYNDDSKTLRVNEKSMELTFPTFYLGNRIVDNQFGDLVMDSYVDLFNYDCSVLLGSTYNFREPRQCNDSTCGNISGYCMQYYEFDKLEEIEILELHYENNGVVYKCQVSGGNLSPGDPGYDEIEPENPDNPLFPNWPKLPNIKGELEKIIKLVLGLMGGILIIYVISLLLKILNLIPKRKKKD